MKKLILFAVSLCITILLYAQTLKNENVTTNSLTSKTDTTKRTVPNITNKGKSDAPNLKTLPQSRQVLTELGNAIHSNLQMQSGFLNRPTTSRNLMSLTGNDKISAQKLLMELENNIRRSTAASPKSPSQPQSNSTNNVQTVGLLAKVQNLNRMMSMNNTGVNNTENTSSDLNRPGNGHLNPERNFELNRMESEKQTAIEMEKYRSELMNRLIMEEYSRLNNNQTSGMPENSMSKNSKLAQYRTLRDLVREQQIRAEKTSAANSVNSKNQIAIPFPMEGLAKQLDQKIREEEQSAEMLTRHRMEMEQKNQTPNQNK